MLGHDESLFQNHDHRAVQYSLCGRNTHRCYIVKPSRFSNLVGTERDCGDERTSPIQVYINTGATCFWICCRVSVVRILAFRLRSLLG
jgi:hypothetical protein